MKKTLLIPFLFFALTGMTQKNDSSSKQSYEYYLAKSKKQKTAGWILLGAGTTMMLSGAIIGYAQLWNDLGNLFEPENQSHSAAGEILFFTGLAGMVTSVPLLISGSRNKKNAIMMKSSFRMQSVTYPGAYYSSRKYYPGLTLTIKL